MAIIILIVLIVGIWILIKSGILNVDKLKEILNTDKLKEKLNQMKTNDQNDSEVSRYRYPSLRIIAGIISVFAAIVMIASVGVGIYFFYKGSEHGGSETDIIFGVISIAVGGFNVLILSAVAESIKVVIDIEYNTRKTAESASPSPSYREREPIKSEPARRESQRIEPSRKAAISVDDI